MHNFQAGSEPQNVQIRAAFGSRCILQCTFFPSRGFLSRGTPEKFVIKGKKTYLNFFSYFGHVLDKNIHHRSGMMGGRCKTQFFFPMWHGRVIDSLNVVPIFTQESIRNQATETRVAQPNRNYVRWSVLDR